MWPKGHYSIVTNFTALCFTLSLSLCEYTHTHTYTYTLITCHDTHDICVWLIRDFWITVYKRFSTAALCPRTYSWWAICHSNLSLRSGQDQEGLRGWGVMLWSQRKLARVPLLPHGERRPSTFSKKLHHCKMKEKRFYSFRLQHSWAENRLAQMMQWCFEICAQSSSRSALSFVLPIIEVHNYK